MTQTLAKVHIYRKFSGVKLYDNESENAQEVLSFSLLNRNLKIWMIINQTVKCPTVLIMID